MTPLEQIESILVTAGASIAKIASESEDALTRVTASQINNQLASMMLPVYLAKQAESETKETKL